MLENKNMQQIWRIRENMQRIKRYIFLLKRFIMFIISLENCVSVIVSTKWELQYNAESLKDLTSQEEILSFSLHKCQVECL